MLLAGCLALVVLAAVGAGGYLGYRYWSTLSGGDQSTVAGDQYADADWASADLASPDLTQGLTEIDPHVARLADALKSRNLEQVISMTLSETREDLKSAFEGHADRMERFGRLLATRRLTVLEGDLAEFEVTEDGRAFVVTFQRVGNNWALHSF